MDNRERGYIPDLELPTNQILENYKPRTDLSLAMVNLEHQDQTFSEHRQIILNAIQDSDTVILEYFPDVELSDLVANTIPGLNYFRSIAELCQQEDKSITVLDPCYNNEFIKIVGLQEIPRYASVSTITALTANFALDKFYHKPTNILSRRKFLTLSSGVIGALFSINTHAMSLEHDSKIPFNTLPHYQAFRRAVVAKGLEKISGNVSFFYPPAHNLGIKEFLENPDFLAQAFSLAQVLQPALPSIFQLRKYEFKSGNWKKVQQEPIE